MPFSPMRHLATSVYAVTLLGVAACGPAHLTPRAPHVTPPPRAHYELTPVEGAVEPRGYLRLSKDGRFAFSDGYVYDRAECQPRARVGDEALAGAWIDAAGPYDGRAVADAVKAATGDENEYRTCGEGLFDPIANAIDIVCSRQGAEYEITEHAWARLGATDVATLCLAHEPRSDHAESFGDDVRWSPNGQMFTFLELDTGWNYHLRWIHVVDLRAGTHVRIDDEAANAQGLPPSYDRVVGFDTAAPAPSGEPLYFTVDFDPATKSVFLERNDGERLALFDDHRWPSDEGAESPWSRVTRVHRFRTSRDPLGGEMLAYDEVERTFRVPGLFQRFVRGLPLPPRPPPRIDVPPQVRASTPTPAH